MDGHPHRFPKLIRNPIQGGEWTVDGTNFHHHTTLTPNIAHEHSLAPTSQ